MAPRCLLAMHAAVHACEPATPIIAVALEVHSIGGNTNTYEGYRARLRHGRRPTSSSLNPPPMTSVVSSIVKRRLPISGSMGPRSVGKISLVVHLSSGFCWWFWYFCVDKHRYHLQASVR